MNSKCKKCKYCNEIISLITLAEGGCTYKCNLTKEIVGHFDIINQKYSQYHPVCSKYIKKEPKQIIWKKKKCSQYSFELKNDDYFVKGGHRSTSQLQDKTWCGIRFKNRPKLDGVFYLNIDYPGFISEEFENEIIKLILDWTGKDK